MEGKYHAELSYWMSRFIAEGRQFGNAHYKNLMLTLLGQPDDEIFQGKIVMDFGCGPRGSLCWTEAPHRCFGVDVLVPEYMKLFGECLEKHAMEYVPCTESSIPLPDNSIDILFTINSLDHVSDLDKICIELLRVLKPGGILAGSFNLHEPACATEPQCLDEQTLCNHLFRHLAIQSYRVALKTEPAYGNLMKNELLSCPDPEQPCILWVTGEKK